jgi:lactate permease
MGPVRVLFALIPPAVAAALLVRRVSSPRAALLSLAAGAALLPVFPVSLASLERGEAAAAVTGIEVILIILGGILLYELMSLAGAHAPLGEWIAGASDDPARCILLIVLGLTPFAESVTGFGVGAIIALPILRRIGLPPARAAALSLLGLVAVPWGGLGPGTLIASRLTGVSLQTLGVQSAVLSLPIFLVAGFAALALGLGLRPALRKAGELALVALGLWAGIWSANQAAGTPLAGALGSLAGIGTALVIVRARERRLPRLDHHLARGVLPYAVLAGLLLFSHLAIPVGGASEGSLDRDFSGLLHAVLLSPATWLVVTCVLTPALLGETSATIGSAIRLAAGRWWPVAVTTLAFLALGALMTVSGMASVLAHAASGIGRGYLALAPWIGGVGGFLTGSNAGANAMFSTAQAGAAAHLGLPADRVVAVQNVSASLATMSSAPRIALAQSLLGPRERDVRIFYWVALADAAALAVLSGVAMML